MQRNFILALICLAVSITPGAATPSDYPRAYVSKADGQVWVQATAEAKPFVVAPASTHKGNPIRSPDGRRFAYEGVSWLGEPGDGFERVVVADWTGKIRLNTEDLLLKDNNHPNSHCAAINNLEWIDNDRLGIDCHATPSVSDYSVISISAGRPVARFLGLNFVWSPDRHHVAHTGLIVHFAPPFAQNECALIDNRTVSYRSCDTSSPHPDSSGRLYRNVHSIQDGASFIWSPDSRQVAYIDDVADWRIAPDADLAAPAGVFIHDRRYLAVASTTHDAAGWRLESSCGAPVTWRDKSHIAVACTGKTMTFDTTHDPPQDVPR